MVNDKVDLQWVVHGESPTTITHIFAVTGVVRDIVYIPAITEDGGQTRKGNTWQTQQ